MKYVIRSTASRMFWDAIVGMWVGDIRRATVYHQAYVATQATQAHPVLSGVAYVEYLTGDDELFTIGDRKNLVDASAYDRARIAAEIFGAIHKHLPERITCGHTGCVSPESSHPPPKDAALRQVNRCRCDPMMVVMAHMRAAVRECDSMWDRSRRGAV